MLSNILGTGSRKIKKTDGTPHSYERKTRHVDV